MRNISWWGIVGLLFLVSCVGGKAQQSFWDNKTGMYIIPWLGISYTVPSDIENWAIADIDSSVPKIKFCGMDHSTGICIVIVEPDSRLKSVTELDSVKVRNILREIICQTPTGHILQLDPNLERSRYADSESWCFRTDISIANNSDTVKISYLGHIFDCPNRKVAGIVSIVPTEVLDSVGVQTTDKYFDGMNLIMNN